MFALLDNHSFGINLKAKELMYFYVDESFRNFGIGKKMLDEAKKIALQKGSQIVVFDTLNPNLNQFYKKQGAKEICDSQLLGAPTTVLRISIK